MLTVEMLMLPRIKIIALVPKCFVPQITVGIIYTAVKDGNLYYFNLFPDFRIESETANNYPHLFKPLPWYECREEKDMPEYVKFGRHNIKVQKYNQDGQDFIIQANSHSMLYLPATAEEYTAFINSKQ